MLKNRKYIGVIVILTLLILLDGITINAILGLSFRNTTANAYILEAEVQANAEVTSGELLNTLTVDKVPEVVRYVVKPGDTLELVASTYNVNISTIAESNKISKDIIIKEGQELKFPSVDGILYNIKSGETLSDISIAYDLRVEEIVSANKIDSPDKLKIDQEIIIPGATKLKTVKTNSNSGSTKAAQTSSNEKLASRSSTASKQVSLIGRWPLSGSITSRFGTRWGKLHKGIDIAAKTGTDVYAFMAGTVTFSGWDNGGLGNLVIINHGNGLTTYYGHNSKLFVKAGQSISKGQHIADVGSTGNSTGPHSHFEVRKNGVPVNPLSYLK